MLVPAAVEVAMAGSAVAAAKFAAAKAGLLAHQGVSDSESPDGSQRYGSWCIE